MLPGAVIAAQGAEIVFAERLDAGFGIDLGGREISLLQFDHAVSASAGALEWPQAPQIGIIIRNIPVAEIAARFGIARSTLYRALLKPAA
jgi:hypothetical protein